VIGTDSGALHLAAVMGAPAVALFGPGDPVMFAPPGDSSRLRIIRAGLPCSPCGSFEDPPCGAISDPECVTAIDVGAVLNAAGELLQLRSIAPRRLTARAQAQRLDDDHQRLTPRSS